MICELLLHFQDHHALMNLTDFDRKKIEKEKAKPPGQNITLDGTNLDSTTFDSTTLDSETKRFEHN